MRLKKFTLIFFAITALSAFMSSQSFTNSIQPQAGKTGCTIAPTEQNCGTSACHNTTANQFSGNVTITFSGPDQKYVLGQTYDMTVTTTEAGMVKFGFEITVVNSDGDPIGTWIIPGGNTTISKPIIGAVNSRKYLAHKNASSTNSWTFQWQAPTIDEGTICFFAAGNAANGNNDDNGDHIYTTSLCITPDSSAGISSGVAVNGLFRIESIASGQIAIQYELAASDHVQIRIYNLNGMLIQTLFDGEETPGTKEQVYKLDEKISSGLYLVRFTSGNTDGATKILIQ